jgi:hypothetical protein
MLVMQAAAGFAGVGVDRWRDGRACDWPCLLQGRRRERPKKAAGRFEVAMPVLSWKDPGIAVLNVRARSRGG